MPKPGKKSRRASSQRSTKKKSVKKAGSKRPRKIATRSTTQKRARRKSPRATAAREALARPPLRASSIASLAAPPVARAAAAKLRLDLATFNTHGAVDRSGVVQANVAQYLNDETPAIACFQELFFEDERFALDAELLGNGAAREVSGDIEIARSDNRIYSTRIGSIIKLAKPISIQQISVCRKSRSRRA